MVNVCVPVTVTAFESVKIPLLTVTVTAEGIFRATLVGEVKDCVVAAVRATPGIITPMVSRAAVGMPMTMSSVLKLEPTARFDMVTAPVTAPLPTVRLDGRSVPCVMKE